MTSRGRSRPWTWIALAAAYLMLAQVAWGGSPDRPAAFDAFAVICTHVGDTGAPAKPAQHPHDGGCCLAACAAAALLPADWAVLPTPRAGGVAVAFREALADHGERRPRGSSPTIRGPPTAA